MGIGTTAPIGLLDVENPTPATPQNVIFNTGGNLGIGTTAPQAALYVAGSVTPVGYVDVYSNTLNAVPFVNRAARGTLANPQPVTTNDIIGGFTGRGYYAAAGGQPAGFSGGRGSMIVKANEPWTALAQSTYVIFNTSPLGQAYQTERMRIDNAGNVGINTTTPGGAPVLPLAAPVVLEVNGNVMLTANSGAGFIFQDGSTQTTAFTGANNTTGAAAGFTGTLSGDVQGIQNSTQVIATHLGSPLPIVQGGTGLTAVPATGQYLRGTGGGWQASAIQAGDLPSLSGNYVDLTSAQPTIGGAKTFIAPMTISAPLAVNAPLTVNNFATATALWATGTTTGVYGSGGYYGLSGVSSTGYGAFGSTASGTGVEGAAMSTSGANYGVYGQSSSGSGIAGAFNNSAGGKILS